MGKIRFSIMAECQYSYQSWPKEEMHAPPTANGEWPKDLKTKESYVFLFWLLAPERSQMVERLPAKF